MMTANMATAARPTSGLDLAQRVDTLDWSRIETELDQYGAATTGQLLTAAECVELASAYEAEAGFRSRVIMAQHGFGSGEYRYYSYPLSEPVAALRSALYPRSADIAHRWERALNRPGHCP